MTEQYPYKPIPTDLPRSDWICCKEMQRHLTLNSECEQHGYNCPDRGIEYFNGSYHIRAPNSYYVITYCPWCGERLTNEVKYPRKITREVFDQLLCHNCALPLKDVMCGTCCECVHCFKDKCVGKYRWAIEEQPGSFSVYGTTSSFAPRHTDQPEKGWLYRLWNWITTA
jgi:hypothetical protein